MAVPKMRGSLSAVASAVALPMALVVVLCGVASSAQADEIRLKDGKKLYGVIVAYEDNMFKVKTDFGYVLVEKDKIAAIIPDTPGNSAAKSGIVEPAKPVAEKKPPKPAAVPKNSTGDSAASTPTNDAANNEAPKVDPEQVKREKAAAIVGNANARPELPSSSAANGSATGIKSPALKTASTPAMAPKNALAGNAAPPPPPKAEPPSNVEEVQGNQYLNHTYGFRMFKAPSWQLIPAAEQTLPNAIVAMGTNNESTLLVISREKTKLPLETAAGAIEQRLHDVYENYRLISTR